MIAVRLISRTILGILAAGLVTMLAGAAPTFAAGTCEGCSPRWQLTSSAAPTNLPPGGEGQIAVAATNLGDAPVNASTTPVTITDKLPRGVTATAIPAYPSTYVGWLKHEMRCSLPAPSLVSCTWTGPEPLPPYETLEVRVAVKVAEGAQFGEENEATITGGEAPSASIKQPVTVDSTPTPFGVDEYTVSPENDDGSLDTQAGSHPFQLTSTIAFYQTLEANQQFGKLPTTPSLVRDLRIDLPPGLIGNPTPFPQCTLLAFDTLGPNLINRCPSNTAMGVASVSIQEPRIFGMDTIGVPLFNLTPAAGEPARFGFEVLAVPVTLDTSVRTGSDYGVTVSVNNVSEAAALLTSRVTFWGVPGDPRHDQSRGWECLRGESGCVLAGQEHPAPFLTLPTSCTGPLKTSGETDSWAQPGSVLSFSPSVPMESLDGCNSLGFEPTISVAPDGQAASTPTGLTVGVHVPQEISLNPTGLAEADVKDTTVALPAGVQLSPSGGNGLQACSDAQIGFTGVNPQTGTDEFTSSAPSCPEVSKIATVKIKTPLLPNPLEGAVYLAAPQNFAGLPQNPFESLIAMYIVAEDPVSGVLVKLPGKVVPNPVTGQLVTTFENTPQLPFEDLELHFFGGERAPLSTPALCGVYTTQASIAPWSGNEPATPSSSFDITSGPNGAPCPDPQPFSPGFNAQTTNIQAGAFTPFTLTMTRPDADQTLSRIETLMPPGLSGTLSNVKLCGEPQASLGTCGAESLIGETVVSAGLGNDPYTVTGGKVYITTGYKGAPFGLSIVNPAAAGPFVLDEGRPIVVRAQVFVDPHTAALRIVSDPLPTILDGIPLQIQHVNVTINREKFTFNPTNCNKTALNGTLTSSEGATAAVSTPFQVTDCEKLAFKPKLTVSTSGKTSRSDRKSVV